MEAEETHGSGVVFYFAVVKLNKMYVSLQHDSIFYTLKRHFMHERSNLLVTFCYNIDMCFMN